MSIYIYKYYIYIDVNVKDPKIKEFSISASTVQSMRPKDLRILHIHPTFSRDVSMILEIFII